MVAVLEIGILSDQNKVGRFKAHVAEPTASTIAAELTAVASLQAAVVGLSLGTFGSRGLTMDRSDSAILPTAVVQLGEKWVITAQDSSGNKYTYTIPGADLGASNVNLITGTHKANLSSGAWSAFVTAFNGVVISRTGTGLTVVSARLGTRLGS